MAHGHDAGVALVEPGLLDRPHHRLAVGAGDLALQLEAELAVEQEVGVAEQYVTAAARRLGSVGLAAFADLTKAREVGGVVVE